MTSRHIIMGRAMSTGCSVMWLASQSRQPLFANNVAGTAHFNRVMAEGSKGQWP